MLHAGGAGAGNATGVHTNPYTFGGNSLAYRTGSKQIGGERVNRFVGETFARTAATPDGYDRGWLLPVVAGGMSSWQAEVSFSGAGELIQGGPMTGTGSIAFTTGGNLSLTVGLSGTGAFVFGGTGGLALTIGLDGAGNITITGAGSLSMIVPIDGTGAITVTGSANLKGLLDLEGSWGGATPLSPEALAQAVWAELNINGDAYGALLTNAEKQAKLAAALSA